MRVAAFDRVLPVCLVVAVLQMRGGDGSSSSVVREVAQKTEKEKYIIDTDAGADDAVAISYVLGAERLNRDIEVVAITCVNGNTVVDNVLVNVLKTLSVNERLDIPVYKGASEPILKKVPVDEYFGKDGFGDFDFPNAPSPSLAKKKHAVNALVRYVTDHPGQITLLCLGPLTNIALAVRMYPDFLSRVKDVYILGGAVEGKGYMKPGIEFNFYVDPESVAIVLESAAALKKNITILPAEASIIRGCLPLDWRLNVLGALDNPVVKFLNQAERKTFHGFFGNSWSQADQLLVAIALNNSLIDSSLRHPMQVETCGEHARGAAFVDYKDNSGNSTVRIVTNIRLDEYKELLLRYLDLSAGGPSPAVRLAAGP